MLGGHPVFWLFNKNPRWLGSGGSQSALWHLTKKSVGPSCCLPSLGTTLQGLCAAPAVPTLFMCADGTLLWPLGILTTARLCLDLLQDWGLVVLWGWWRPLSWADPPPAHPPFPYPFTERWLHRGGQPALALNQKPCWTVYNQSFCFHFPGHTPPHAAHSCSLQVWFLGEQEGLGESTDSNIQQIWVQILTLLFIRFLMTQGKLY